MEIVLVSHINLFFVYRWGRRSSWCHKIGEKTASPTKQGSPIVSFIGGLFVWPKSSTRTGEERLVFISPCGGVSAVGLFRPVCVLVSPLDVSMAFARAVALSLAWLSHSVMLGITSMLLTLRTHLSVTRILRPSHHRSLNALQVYPSR